MPSDTERTDRPAVTRALASAALFGLSAPAAKWLLATIDPWLLAGLLYLGSGLGLAAFWLARRALGASREAPLRRADLPWLGAAIASGGVLAPGLLMLALARGTASQASLLLSFEGAFTALIAWRLFREELDARLAVGLGLITAGGIVLGWPAGGARPGPAAPLVLAACLAWALDNNLTRKLSGGDSVLIAAVKGTAAGTVNLVLATTLMGARWPAGRTTLAAAIVGLLAYGVSLVLFVRSLADLGAARTSAYFATAPFIGAVGAVVALGEPRTPRLGVSAACMALGLWLYVAERHGHAHAHASLEHEHRHRHDAHHAHRDALAFPHSHPHVHAPMTHAHPHSPDLHHRDDHR